MSNANGCKIVLTALVVALVMGGLGFATGYLTHAVLFADGAPPPPQTIVREIVVTATGAPGESLASPASPTEPSSPVPPTPTSRPTLAPTPAPTVAIPPAQGSTFDLFWEAWELVQRDYYGTLPSEEEMTYAAIRGALGTLDDPFTGFIEPRVAAINRQDDSGSFEGIGAYVMMEDGWLKIVSTFKDQPAERAGLRGGDIVLKVDDTDIVNMSIYEAITLIRGPAGTQVRLTILRQGQDPFEVKITRASIEIPVVEFEMRTDGLGYVRLFDFSSDANIKLAEAIQKLQQQGAQGLILDLRGNPGGWLNEAVLVAGLFLPQNEIVVIERYRDADPQVLRTPDEPVAPDIPLVVLVNGGSASASEIVAGALQDYGRAELIGELTFGKGSVQWPHELSNGAELRVTVARWFTPNDRAIHGEGLAPDIVVELTEEDVAAERDPQLERAVEYLLHGQ